MFGHFSGDRIKTPEKIFLARSSNLSRTLQNLTKVEIELAKRGFTVVYPELLSIEEQLWLFQNAKEIVAQNGAALTNLIFTSKLDHFVQIVPRANPQMAEFWKSFAEVLGISVSTCFGKPSTSIGLKEDSYVIDLQDLIEKIN